MKSGILKGNFLSRNQLTQLPDRTLHIINNAEINDVLFTTADPNGKAKVGSLLYNTTNETLWVSTPTGWKQLKLGGGGGDLDPTTWQGIRNIVRAGKAQEYFAIGDEINLAKYNATNGAEYDFLLIVADFKNVTLENGSSVPAMTLLSKWSLDVNMPLSPKVHYTFTGYADEIVQGYERYDWCIQRQWLNGSGTDWFTNYWVNNFSEITPEIVDDRCTSVNSVEAVGDYTGLTGFMSRISPELAEVLAPIKINTVFYNNTTKAETTTVTYDKVFIPSTDNLYMMGFYNNSGAITEETLTGENGPIEYFKQKWLALGKTELRNWGSDNTLAEQCSPAIDGSWENPTCWTRSASTRSGNQTNTGGWGTTRSNTDPKNSYYIRPLMTIA